MHLNYRPASSLLGERLHVREGETKVWSAWVDHFTILMWVMGQMATAKAREHLHLGEQDIEIYV